MFLDLIKFNGVQHPLLLKDTPLYPYFPNVMNKRRLLQGQYFIGRNPDPLGQESRKPRNPFRMAPGILILGINRG